MDTITHAISGAVIGAATSVKHPGEMRRRALWGALFAAFPDSDAAMVLFADHFTYLNEHRGYTHSVVMLPVWAALLGSLAALPATDGFIARWRNMAALAAAALAAHILGDLITSYGTKVFTPLYDAPLAFPITFIIDPLFTLILLAGLIAALWRTRPMFATASGALLLAYLALQATQYQSAARVGEAYAQSINAPQAPVIVLPQPLSPFNWKIVVVADGDYHRAYINLLADAPRAPADATAGFITRLRAAYRPRDALEWRVYPRWPSDREYREIAQSAWQQPAFAGFRRFALLPYVTSMHGDERRLCVWFTDLRFTLPARATPFEYAMCREGNAWVLDFEATKPMKTTKAP